MQSSLNLELLSPLLDHHISIPSHREGESKHSETKYPESKHPQQNSKTILQSLRKREKLLKQNIALLESSIKRNKRGINFLMLSVMIGTGIYLITRLFDYYSYKDQTEIELGQLRDQASQLLGQMNDLGSELSQLRINASFYKTQYESAYYWFDQAPLSYRCREDFWRVGSCGVLINTVPKQDCFPVVPWEYRYCEFDHPFCYPSDASYVCYLRDVVFDIGQAIPLVEKQLANLSHQLKNLYELMDQLPLSFYEWFGNAGFILACLLGEVSPAIIITLTFLTNICVDCFPLRDVQKQLDLTKAQLTTYDAKEAFLQGTHPRLGKDSLIRTILVENPLATRDVLKEIFDMLGGVREDLITIFELGGHVRNSFNGDGSINPLFSFFGQLRCTKDADDELVYDPSALKEIYEFAGWLEPKRRLIGR